MAGVANKMLHISSQAITSIEIIAVPYGSLFVCMFNHLIYSVVGNTWYAVTCLVCVHQLVCELALFSISFRQHVYKANNDNEHNKFPGPACYV